MQSPKVLWQHITSLLGINLAFGRNGLAVPVGPCTTFSPPIWSPNFHLLYCNESFESIAVVPILRSVYGLLHHHFLESLMPWGRPRAGSAQGFTFLSSKDVKNGSHFPGNERCGVETLRLKYLGSPKLGIGKRGSELESPDTHSILNVSSHCLSMLKAQAFDHQNNHVGDLTALS